MIHLRINLISLKIDANETIVDAQYEYPQYFYVPRHRLWAQHLAKNTKKVNNQQFRIIVGLTGNLVKSKWYFSPSFHEHHDRNTNK